MVQQGGVTLDERKQSFIEFASGVLTGINLHRAKGNQIRVDPVALELSLKNHCTKNPTDYLAHAVFVFAGESS